MTCGICHRCGSDPALLWLWRRPAAASLIQPLAWEPPYATGVALKRQKGKKKKERESLTSSYWFCSLSHGDPRSVPDPWVNQRIPYLALLLGLILDKAEFRLLKMLPQVGQLRAYESRSWHQPWQHQQSKSTTMKFDVQEEARRKWE